LQLAKLIIAYYIDTVDVNIYKHNYQESDPC